MLRIFRNKTESTPDEDLVRQYQANSDMEVLGKLYERYMELVYGVCLKYLKDSALAEDGVMSIFEQLTVKLKKYEVKNFKSWLHVLTKNYCLMQIRKENKASLTIFYDTELMQSVDLPHPIDESYEINGQREQALKHCIEHLPLDQKKCVELFYLQEKSYKEIAAMTGEKLSKVRSYIQNGRRNLKICIEKKNEQ